MILCDTHTHLYLDAFDNDRNEVVENAIKEGVKFMFLPNIDSGSVKGMLDLCMEYPDNCFPMMGLHPTSVKKDFQKELENVELLFKKHDFIAVGEIGIDLYWDISFEKEQVEAFIRQLEIASTYKLPVVIHSRNSIDKLIDLITGFGNVEAGGVFHCFTGTVEQAHKITDLGFYLGIGGVLTFKNSNLHLVLKEIDLKHILLETDAPFLAPVPYRGKRNQSSYIRLVAEKLTEIKGISIEETAHITTANSMELFKIDA